MKKNYLLYFTLLGIVSPYFAVQSQETLQISNVSLSFNECSTIISWNTNRATSESLDIGTDKNYGLHFGSPQFTTSHRITATLKPETTYHYRITAQQGSDSVFTFDRTFKTPKCVYRRLAVISDVRVAYVTGTTATIQWQTDIPADTVVRYGKTNAYGSSVSSKTRATSHDITLKNLAVLTTYHFKVESKTEDGFTSTYYDLTFTTLINKTTDTDALALSNVRPLTTNDSLLQTNSAVVSWNTNKLATGRVRYGVYPKLTKTLDAQTARSFFHSIPLTGLQEDTEYAFAVESKDVFGKTVKSDTFSFRTKKASGSTSQSHEPTTEFVMTALTRPTALYRAHGDTAIYAIFNNQKFLIPGISSLERYITMGLVVQTVAPSVIYPLSDVKLIKPHHRTTVYYVYHRAHNKRLKLALPSKSVFESYTSNQWGKIVTLHADDVERISTAKFISLGGSSPVYFLDLGSKRSIGGYENVLRFGYQTSDIVTVNELHLARYSTGAPLR